MYGVGSANYNGSVMNFDYTGSVQTATLTLVHINLNAGALKVEIAINQTELMVMVEKVAILLVF